MGEARIKKAPREAELQSISAFIP